MPTLLTDLTDLRLGGDVHQVRGPSWMRKVRRSLVGPARVVVALAGWLLSRPGLRLRDGCTGSTLRRAPGIVFQQILTALTVVAVAAFVGTTAGRCFVTCPPPTVTVPAGWPHDMICQLAVRGAGRIRGPRRHRILHRTPVSRDVRRADTVGVTLGVGGTFHRVCAPVILVFRLLPMVRLCRLDDPGRGLVPLPEEAAAVIVLVAGEPWNHMPAIFSGLGKDIERMREMRECHRGGLGWGWGRVVGVSFDGTAEDESLQGGRPVEFFLREQVGEKLRETRIEVVRSRFNPGLWCPPPKSRQAHLMGLGVIIIAGAELCHEGLHCFFVHGGWGRLLLCRFPEFMTFTRMKEMLRRELHRKPQRIAACQKRRQQP